MCCFSGDEPVEVASTRIFGRVTVHEEQVLIYSMKLEARHDVAMVLPVPVRDGGRFKFIDFSDYVTVFDDLAALFPKPASKSRGGPTDDLLDGGDDLLAVERVGAFDASYVPTRKDLARLDPRFRIKEDAWKSLPQYADWAFAVFKLRAGSQEIQPMAFQWETRFGDRVYFPTVHIHDGKVHPQADFDHALYGQLPPRGIAPAEWRMSPAPGGTSVSLHRTQRFVMNRRVFHREVVGKFKNADQFLINEAEA